jgi:hypothetical protein
MTEQEDYSAKAAEYRGHAEKLRQLARDSSDEGERGKLLRMAEAWIELADRIKDLSQGHQ